MAIDPYANCNLEVQPWDCTLETCCLAQSSFLYLPNYGGNLFFAIFFGIFIIPQLGLGIWHKTWGFAVGMVIGLALEVLGYAARVMLNDNPWSDNAFLIYLIGLTIAPVFLTAAIYLCITRIIVIYGEHLSRLKPRTIAIAFMTSDFLSLVLQAIGGAIADMAETNKDAQTGINIMIAGLFLQALSLVAFIFVFADFSWTCHKGVLDMDPEKQRIRQSTLFKVFRAGVLLATIMILIRSIFRVAELWEGFEGKLWNNETDFLVLDGAMIAIAVICLTAIHPGAAFGGLWQAANWNFKGKKSENIAEMRTKNVSGASDSQS
ncbi:phospholipid-translocating ATPase rsb1 [Vermiconidia calcicola]|uniref:Phospholipid-translocating ATPase rsb1 n=1 Tax=Vermiconidia calcicola TaxID=1690605 RepID=A0ACC3NZ70_9PEZI|nr:phospholipid-translocating ATPase rsb1 [Vermiconidia calcicola]